ncbi:hypothetical protein ES703_122020 [subsurface metagenome]
MFTGGIAPGMEDAENTVSRLPGKGNLPINGIEGHPKIDQVSDARQGFVN